MKGFSLKCLNFSLSEADILICFKTIYYIVITPPVICAFWSDVSIGFTSLCVNQPWGLFTPTESGGEKGSQDKKQVKEGALSKIMITLSFAFTRYERIFTACLSEFIKLRSMIFHAVLAVEQLHDCAAFCIDKVPKNCTFRIQSSSRQIVPSCHQMSTVGGWILCKICVKLWRAVYLAIFLGFGFFCGMHLWVLYDNLPCGFM